MGLIRYEITVGVGLDRTGQEINFSLRRAALLELRKLAVEMFGGVTLIHGHGGWKDSTDSIVEETTVTFLIDAKGTYADEDKVAAFVQEAGKQLRQAAVHVGRLPMETTDVEINHN